MKQLTIFFLCAIGFTFLNLKVNAQLKLYGGKNYDVFLGCLNCSTDDINSVWSNYSVYGSMHNAKSIWNPDGKFGSKTSDYSPFNRKAKCPPVILDKNGKSHGYVTVNKKFPKRSSNGMAISICEDRDEIVKDIPGYYKSIYGIKYKK